MRAAAVLDMPHAPVGRGDLVAAHPEGGPQRATDLEVEGAGATVLGSASCHVGAWAEVAVLPAGGRLKTGRPGHHPDPAEAELHGDVLDTFVVRLHVRGHESRVVRRGRQQIADTQVTRL